MWVIHNPAHEVQGYEYETKLIICQVFTLAVTTYPQYLLAPFTHVDRSATIRELVLEIII